VLFATTLLLLTGRPGQPAAATTPAQGLVAFVRFDERIGHPAIYVLDPAGGAARKLDLRVPAADSPAWRPDGSRLAFVGGMNLASLPRVTEAEDLYLARRDGRGQRRLTTSATHDVGPAWSPDGRRIVYVRSLLASPSRSSIVVRDLAGTVSRRLTFGSLDLQPSWSHDGRVIVFLRIDSRTRRSGIWTVRPDGSGLRRILAGLPRVTQPVWSPVGNRLVVTDGRSLMIINPDSSGRRVIALLQSDQNGDRIDPEPAWSPDGRAIAFAQLRMGSNGRRADVWAVNVDGTSLRRLTVSPGKDLAPAWGA
jgi:TolB protein